jgi:hypothetical protein
MKYLFVFALLTFGSLGGCDHPDTRAADWDFIHAAVIIPSCATSSCHSSLSRNAGVDLEDVDGAYQFLTVDNQFVVAGDSRSPLMFLLEGDERPLMPPDAPLPAADVDLIRQWIEEGALR